MTGGLIEADAVTQGAEKMRMASQEMLHDTYPLVERALASFGEDAGPEIRA